MWIVACFFGIYNNISVNFIILNRGTYDHNCIFSILILSFYKRISNYFISLFDKELVQEHTFSWILFSAMSIFLILTEFSFIFSWNDINEQFIQASIMATGGSGRLPYDFKEINNILGVLEILYDIVTGAVVLGVTFLILYSTRFFLIFKAIQDYNQANNQENRDAFIKKVNFYSNMCCALVVIQVIILFIGIYIVSNLMIRL